MTTNNCANSPKLVLKDLCKKFLGEMSCIQFFTHLTCFCQPNLLLTKVSSCVRLVVTIYLYVAGVL